jgi:hypothetical protein
MEVQGKLKKKQRLAYIKEHRPRYIQLSGKEVECKVSLRELENDFGMGGRHKGSVFFNNPLRLLFKLAEAYMIKPIYDVKRITENKCRVTLELKELDIYASSQRTSMHAAKTSAVQQVFYLYKCKLYTKNYYFK